MTGKNKGAGGSMLQLFVVTMIMGVVLSFTSWVYQEGHNGNAADATATAEISSGR